MFDESAGGDAKLWRQVVVMGHNRENAPKATEMDA